MPDNHDYQAFPVPRPGIEPGWILLHWCVRPARLPIPPSGLLRCKVIQTICLVQIFNHFFVIFALDTPPEGDLKQTGVGRVVGNHHRQRDADKSTCRQGKATERFGNISNKNHRFLLISPIFYQISI